MVLGLPTLVHRPSPAPVFDCLQYAKNFTADISRMLFGNPLELFLLAQM